MSCQPPSSLLKAAATWRCGRVQSIPRFNPSAVVRFRHGSRREDILSHRKHRIPSGRLTLKSGTVSPGSLVLVFSIDHVRFLSCSCLRILLETPLSPHSPLNMSDPLFDALLASDPYTATALPAPLQPSRATTPSGIHSNTSVTSFRPSTSNNPTKDIEAERRADEAEALFDPLQGEQHNYRVYELI